MRDARGDVGLAASLLMVLAMGLAAGAALAPWLKWRQDAVVFDVEVTHTDNTSLAFGLLPPMGCFPSYGGVSEECTGALTRDGRLARAVGTGARLLFLVIWASGAWLIVRRGARVSQFLFWLLLVPVMCLALSIAALNVALTDRVILGDDPTLPRLVGVDWRGPALLLSAALVWGGVGWRLIARDRAPT